MICKGTNDVEVLTAAYRLWASVGEDGAAHALAAPAWQWEAAV